MVRGEILELRMTNLVRYMVAGVAMSVVGALVSWILWLFSVNVPGIQDLLGLPTKIFQAPFSVFLANGPGGTLGILIDIGAFLVVVTAMGATYAVTLGYIERHVPPNAD